MHHLYHTHAFVLGSGPFGEANRVFTLFTRELGLIKASAQGVRFLKSKLRYSLHDFSLCTVSLVRGKETWRVTGAVKELDVYHALRATPLVLGVFARVFSLLDRLLSGEDKNELLFVYLLEAVQFAVKGTLSVASVRNFEYILVLRTLSCLGYLGASPDTEPFVASPYWSEELLSAAHPLTGSILQEINKSLRESQL